VYWEFKMPKAVVLRVRDVKNVLDPFHIKNFHLGGWRVRHENKWIRMVPENTLIKNPDHDPAVHAPDDTEFPLYTQVVSE
jgi:hypothetical protein